jgi:hypothetical protein
MEDDRSVRIKNVDGDVIGNAVSGSDNIIGKKIQFNVTKAHFIIVDPTNELSKKIMESEYGSGSSAGTERLNQEEGRSIIKEILDLRNKNDPEKQTKTIKVNELKLEIDNLKQKEAEINAGQFRSKVIRHRFWKFFEIKSCLQRCETNEWRVRFLYVRLLNTYNSTRRELSTAHLKLIYEIRSIDMLDKLLKQILRGRTVAVGAYTVSLEWMTDRFKFDTFYRSHPSSGLFGIGEPSHALLQSGNMANPQTNECTLETELENHDPPYENLVDAVHTHLDMRFWSDKTIGGYSPFVVLFAPIPIKIVKVQFTRENITVYLDCPIETDLKLLKVILFDLHRNMTDFIREGTTTSVISSLEFSLDETVSNCKLKLTYDGDTIEERIISRLPYGFHF